jgi:NADPH:quinone reductase-like Zn-dependent oxidoreductase
MYSGPERSQLKSFVQGSLKQGVQWVEEGKLKPYISQIIKLEDAENALQQIRQGKTGFGKVVVKLNV